MKTETLILLFCSNTESRRIKAIFNVLIGKKTVSNLFWGLNYNILGYLDAFHGLDFTDLTTALKDLSKQGMIETPADNFVKLTSAGQAAKERLLSKLTGVNDIQIASEYDVSLFKRRIVLATQIISEYSFGNAKYYPQSIDMLNDSLVKSWFVNNKGDDLVLAMKSLWTTVFSEMPTTLADSYARSLVGHNLFGQTINQIASNNEMTNPEAWLWMYIGDCLLLKTMLTSKDERFSLLMRGLHKELISKSTQSTYDIFIQNDRLSLTQIANKRGVKSTTVREHLLEWAILADNPIPVFKRVLSPALIKQLDSKAPELVVDWKYTGSIEEQFHIDFFEFRMYQIMRSRIIDGR